VLYRLKRHPWTISAHFEWSLALVFAVPREVTKPLLLPGLEPDCYGQWAFVAAAFVKTRKLRPEWAPSWLGRDFFLAGYRVFVRGRLSDGRRVRGLQILGSDTDSWTMAAAGSLLTHYRYRRVRVKVERTPDNLHLTVHSTRRALEVDVTAALGGTDELPDGSPFPDLRTARQFAGPMPFTFSYEPETGQLLAVEGVRENWVPRAVEVEVRRLSFFENSAFGDGRLPVLANAFCVENVEYQWKPGVLIRPPKVE
jgi:hypothetical protein